MEAFAKTLHHKQLLGLLGTGSAMCRSSANFSHPNLASKLPTSGPHDRSGQASLTCCSGLLRRRPGTGSRRLFAVTVAEALALMHQEPPEEPQGQTGAHIHDSRSQSNMRLREYTLGSRRQKAASPGEQPISRQDALATSSQLPQPPADLPPPPPTAKRSSAPSLDAGRRAGVSGSNRWVRRGSGGGLSAGRFRRVWARVAAGAAVSSAACYTPAGGGGRELPRSQESGEGEESREERNRRRRTPDLAPPSSEGHQRAPRTCDSQGRPRTSEPLQDPKAS